MSQLAERAQEQPVTAEEAKEKVKEKGQELKTQTTGRVRQEVEDRTSAASEQVQSLAQTLRRTASELRAQGQEGQGALLDQLAIRAEQLGGYLTQADADRLAEDAKQYASRGVEFARQQKWLIAPVGLGLGLFAARTLGGRSSNGSDSSNS